jgi:hypothetical protein
MGEYDDLVADVRRQTEAAVRESRERVELAGRRAEQADRQASEASDSVGTRWANRVAAMRRRAADRADGPELNLGHEDGPHPNDHTEADDLVTLNDPTPPFGISGDLFDAPPPAYDDEDFADQSWLRDR